MKSCILTEVIIFTEWIVSCTEGTNNAEAAKYFTVINLVWIVQTPLKLSIIYRLFRRKECVMPQFLMKFILWWETGVLAILF